IWGFDLSEMSWSAFRPKQMFDKRWHLRTERFILYQLAMIICLAAECTATYSLSKYENLQTHIEAASFPAPSTPPPAPVDLQVVHAHLYNNDLINTQITTIVFCVLVACLYGAEFFFLLFFPRRAYPKWYNRAKLTAALVITAGLFVAAAASTVVVARRSAYITGVDPTVAMELVAIYYRPPLQYRTWPTNIAYVVLLWLGLI
ncbi:hypothetical protein K439DRAFT_1322482, partial [Ramaria rubella]